MDRSPPGATPRTTPAIPARRPAPGRPEREGDERAERWAWRARLRADPRKHRLYRAAVAVIGTTMVLAGLLTGWLPGPGGIPLVLGGLAVLASEYAWARRLLSRARGHLQALSHWARTRPRWLRWAGTASAAVAVLGSVHLWLVVLGAPEVLPEALTAALARLPGVER